MHPSEPHLTNGVELPGANIAPGELLVSVSNSGADKGGAGPPPNSPAAPRTVASDNREDPLPPILSLTDILLEAPPWLFSAAVHLLLVIVLGLLFIVPPHRDRLDLQFSYYDAEGPDLSGEQFDLPLNLSDASLDDSLQPQPIPEFSTPVAESPAAVPTPLTSQMLPVASDPIRLALTGRGQGMQQALLEAYGGTGGTQRAVMEALRWLDRNQGKRGMWSLQGPYENGASNENEEAATAMALLAFQGAGYTPLGNKNEPFTKTVSKGWTGLLSKQNKDGNFFQQGQGTSQLYTQALCSIAICELYGMTGDDRYREPAQRAVDYCVSIQARQGGWKYFPGTGSDLSVTGWFVMALQSARMAGLNVPTVALDRVEDFLDSVSFEYGSRYGYQEQSPPSLSMSAEGLLCRQYLGWQRNDSRLLTGANYLVQNLPHWSGRERDVYYWYYATQVCHHMEGDYWREWNSEMREVIPSHQEQEGSERGSWDPQGFRWDREGGRLFVTCLSTYMLEVYYRHLPIYQLDRWRGE